MTVPILVRVVRRGQDVHERSGSVHSVDLVQVVPVRREHAWPTFLREFSGGSEQGTPQRAHLMRGCRRGRVGLLQPVKTTDPDLSIHDFQHAVHPRVVVQRYGSSIFQQKHPHAELVRLADVHVGDRGSWYGSPEGMSSDLRGTSCRSEARISVIRLLSLFWFSRKDLAGSSPKRGGLRKVMRACRAILCTMEAMLLSPGIIPERGTCCPVEETGEERGEERGEEKGEERGDRRGDREREERRGDRRRREKRRQERRGERRGERRQERREKRRQERRQERREKRRQERRQEKEQEKEQRIRREKRRQERREETGEEREEETGEVEEIGEKEPGRLSQTFPVLRSAPPLLGRTEDGPKLRGGRVGVGPVVVETGGDS
ncbi:hypothetical protein F7725_023723 [Dissostichus mawsoni]|uniref:Uncharacterized protein n=1 Tax=Dissostichus mawsoni TaxID=36200 RepID=A0A7J5XXF5_DISMA|nr:hypothetical protein F7725_023723 [Dissostichus mawsoni]